MLSNVFMNDSLGHDGLFTPLGNDFKLSTIEYINDRILTLYYQESHSMVNLKKMYSKLKIPVSEFYRNHEDLVNAISHWKQINSDHFNSRSETILPFKELESNTVSNNRLNDIYGEGKIIIESLKDVMGSQCPKERINFDSDILSVENKCFEESIMELQNIEEMRPRYNEAKSFFPKILLAEQYNNFAFDENKYISNSICENHQDDKRYNIVTSSELFNEKNKIGKKHDFDWYTESVEQFYHANNINDRCFKGVNTNKSLTSYTSHNAFFNHNNDYFSIFNGKENQRIGKDVVNGSPHLFSLPNCEENISKDTPPPPPANTPLSTASLSSTVESLNQYFSRNTSIYLNEVVSKLNQTNENDSHNCLESNAYLNDDYNLLMEYYSDPTNKSACESNLPSNKTHNKDMDDGSTLADSNRVSVRTSLESFSNESYSSFQGGAFKSTNSVNASLYNYTSFDRLETLITSIQHTHHTESCPILSTFFYLIFNQAFSHKRIYNMSQIYEFIIFYIAYVAWTEPTNEVSDLNLQTNNTSLSFLPTFLKRLPFLLQAVNHEKDFMASENRSFYFHEFIESISTSSDVDTTIRNELQQMIQLNTLHENPYHIYDKYLSHLDSLRKYDHLELNLRRTAAELDSYAILNEKHVTRHITVERFRKQVYFALLNSVSYLKTYL